MKKGLTELVFILDKSGSMEGLEADTIGGFNSLLRKQKDSDGECILTTVLFDNTYDLLHDRVDLKAVRPMTEKEYSVGGGTALIDAIGKTIHKIEKVQKNTDESYHPEKVLFAIMTDGQENASYEYTSDKVKKMIQKKTDKGWEFLFLGANIDAVETANHLGILESRAKNFHADQKGILKSFDAMANAVHYCACKEVLPENWAMDLEEDFKSR